MTATAAPSPLADTVVRLHPLLAERWSPRSMDPAHRLSDDQVTALLEAARWAPSSSNTQPWRFAVAHRGTAAHDAVVGALASGNRDWAADASALIVAAAAVEDDEGQPRRWAEYDTGQAVAHLTVQAQAEGLHVRQMGGFDADAAHALLGAPAGVRPMAVVAVGVVPADEPDAPTRPRSRHDLADLLLPIEAS